MDWQRIKQFIRTTGDKFVFVEDGEPSLVVMSFRDYERLLRDHKTSVRDPERSLDLIATSFETERLRYRQEELNAWRIDSDLPKISEKRMESVRLEDLPL